MYGLYACHMRLQGWRTTLREPLSEPRRIVSIAPSNTEILHALGLGRRIVGVDRWSDYPPRVRELPCVGSDLRIDVARVAALQPDVVVASLHVPGMEDNLPAMHAAGLPYVAVGGQGLEGVWQDMRFIGQHLGRAARAEKLIDHTRARMAQMAVRFGSIPVEQRPRVHWEWSAHPYVAARRSWITEILEMAGARNAYDDLDVESVRVTQIEAVTRQPDVVVACWCGARKVPSVDRICRRPGWPGWLDTPAIRAGQVGVFSEALFGRPGPRLADGLAALIPLIHPTARPELAFAET
jgi:iron complex transport system substrate-binding protein